MKTNVVMIRKMGGLDVSQRTKDGMFNATALLKQWNSLTGMKKEMGHFMSLKQTEDFIEALLEELNDRNSELPDTEVIKKTKAKTNKDGSRESGAIWMHPYLFIDFAMWINPKFKVQVIKFVYDQLIKQRHLAGDNYRSLSSAASIFPDCDYKRVAKGLNHIVFGKHKSGIRQSATEGELEELNKIQEKLCFAIDMGYITSFEDLMQNMQKMYSNKFVTF